MLVVAALTPDTFEIELLDENIEPIDFEKGYDLIGITAMTQQAKRAFEISDAFRKKGATTIIGGIHATVLPEEAKQYADSVVVGEAEDTWPQVISDFLKKKMKPFYESKTEIDLSTTPFPRYDLLKEKHYNTIWIQTTRGCPHDCEFCAATRVFGKKYRHKSIKQVVEEVCYVKEHFKNSRIAFSDDNLFVDRSFSKLLLREITPLNIRFHAQSDISIAEDDELLRMLVKSGCSFVLVGFESISEDSLKGMDRANWKYRHLSKYSEHIKKIQSMGIGILGAFIVGLDNDDASIFPRLVDFVVDHNLFETQVTISTPLPGTRLRERLDREGRLLQTDWDNYTFSEVNFIPKKMSVEELEAGFVQTYRSIDEKMGYLKKFEYFKNIQRDLLRYDREVFRN